MSKRASGNLTEVRVERPRPSELAETHGAPKVSTKSNHAGTPKTSRTEFGEVAVVSSEYVYTNPYVGSVNNVSENRLNPPTSVVIEQYWACSRWPYTQRVLAVAVGVLVGAVIGLVVTVTVTGKDPEDMLPGFLTMHSAPD